MYGVGVNPIRQAPPPASRRRLSGAPPPPVGRDARPDGTPRRWEEGDRHGRIMRQSAMRIEEARLKAVFDYLDKEMSFQGAACALSGAAGAWILKEIVFSTGHEEVVLAARYSLPAAALLLLVACALFLFERGHLARVYGGFARGLAKHGGVEDKGLDLIVREVRDGQVLRFWRLYYAARLCLLLAGAILVIDMIRLA